MDFLKDINWILSWAGAHPLWVVLVGSIPFSIWAYFRKCFPLPVAYYCFCIPLAVSIIGLGSSVANSIALLLTCLFLVVLIVDSLLIPDQKSFEISREMVKVASIKKPHLYKIHLNYYGSRRVRFQLKDDFPEDCPTFPIVHTVQLSDRKRMELDCEVFPPHRGDIPLRCVHLRIRSFLGLWVRSVMVSAPSKLMVYPDLKQISEYGLLARTNRLSLMGFRKSRKAGQESDFERLRDFTRDDQFKFIDWRSTARRNKLTVRDFQVTQSQRIVFMLDTGRMMVNQASGLSMLDHALNATLMLSYIALSKGDSVGLLCFSNQIDCYVPPRHDSGQMNRILHTGYNQFPKMVESRYDEAFQFMKNKNRRRSLVVLITNVIDDVNANQISKYITNISGKHLPLAVLLRDQNLYEPLDAATLQEGGDKYVAAAAAEILSWRLQVMKNLLHQGALVLDQFPEDITAPLVNQYLEIKARQLL